MISIGVDVGGTKALAVRLDGTEIVDESTLKIGRTTETIDAIIRSVDSVHDNAVQTIGVGIAGLVHQSNGSLIWGPHVPGTNLDVRGAVHEQFAVPVYVDNDANTAAYAELAMGSASGYDNVLFVTLGTGIGGAAVIDGSVYRGGGLAGEWGHVQVDRDGLLCDCGKRGCWETRASGPALVRLAHQVVTRNPVSSLARILEPDAISGESVVAAADAGDETARALVTEVGRSFGQGLAGLVAIFDPELIVVGGGLGSVGESIIGPARRVLSDSLHGGKLRVPPAIEVAALGPSAGAVGAALLAVKEML
jgi:glucokinase